MKHLTLEQRYAIFQMYGLKFSQSKIALIIGVSQATISKEINRNSITKGKLKQKKYHPLQAHHLAHSRKERFYKSRKFTPDMAKFVYGKLTVEQWSPEQIVGYAKRENIPIVSVECIYQYIRADKAIGGTVYTHCRHRLKHRKISLLAGVGRIPNRVSIHSRPAEVNSRERFGDWEMDLIQGKNNSYILTMVERKSRYLEMLKIPDGKKAKCVLQAVKDILSPYKGSVKTITTDNGLEFAMHQLITKHTKAKVYFTDPYSAWQKGTVENTNKLIRQYLQGTMDFNNLSDADIQKIENKINNRPRKILDFLNPNDVFFKNFL